MLNFDSFLGFYVTSCMCNICKLAGELLQPLTLFKLFFTSNGCLSILVTFTLVSVSCNFVCCLFNFRRRSSLPELRTFFNQKQEINNLQG